MKSSSFRVYLNSFAKLQLTSPWCPESKSGAVWFSHFQLEVIEHCLVCLSLKGLDKVRLCCKALTHFQMQVRSAQSHSDWKDNNRSLLSVGHWLDYLLSQSRLDNRNTSQGCHISKNTLWPVLHYKQDSIFNPYGGNPSLNYISFSYETTWYQYTWLCSASSDTPSNVFHGIAVWSVRRLQEFIHLSTQSWMDITNLVKTWFSSISFLEEFQVKMNLSAINRLKYVCWLVDPVCHIYWDQCVSFPWLRICWRRSRQLETTCTMALLD